MQVNKKKIDEALQLNYPENASLRCEVDYITSAPGGIAIGEDVDDCEWGGTM